MICAIWCVRRWLVKRCRLIRRGVLVLRRRRQATMRWWWWALRLLVGTHRVLASWAGLAVCHWRLLKRLLLLRRSRHAITLIIRVEWLRRHLRVLQLSHTIATPVVASCKWRRSRSGWRRSTCVCTPLWTRRTAKCTRLVRLRVHILWERRTSLVRQTIGWLALQ